MRYPMSVARPATMLCLAVCLGSGGALGAAGVQVNGDFETLTAQGWTEWHASWSVGPEADFTWGEDPYEGAASLRLSASSGSFGVYQELCVEPGVPVVIDWAWKGRSAGTGWWEVLLVDAPYSIDAVDDPANHPETVVGEKWEQGFDGAFPLPAEEWATGAFEVTPLSDTVTLVLKCGSTEGGDVEAMFDEVTVTHDSDLLEAIAIEPAEGSTAGGDAVRVLGRILPPGVEVELGDMPLVDAKRVGTCEVVGVTPPGGPGTVDVVIRVGTEEVRLVDAFTYVSDAPQLRRGDCNGDTLINITDAIGLLGYLFLGDATPPCIEACNADDDESLAISDAIFILNFLFTGGATISPPYPDCGEDPTPSTSCEEPPSDC